MATTAITSKRFSSTLEHKHNTTIVTTPTTTTMTDYSICPTEIAASAGKSAPFDDHRGSKHMGGWWIDLEEAKRLGLGQEWWTEREQPDSKAVAIPGDSGASASARASGRGGQQQQKNQQAKQKQKQTQKQNLHHHQQQHLTQQPPADRPVWFYNDGTMYLGPWIEARNGTGGRTVRVEHGLGVSCNIQNENGNCYVGEFQNGSVHGWGRSFWLTESQTWKHNRNLSELQIGEFTGVGEWVGLPCEYHGKFVNNHKHCPAATATLKDGTQRIGPWYRDVPVIFWGRRVFKANWWVDHSCTSTLDGGTVELVDSPGTRRFLRTKSQNQNQNKNSNNNTKKRKKTTGTEREVIDVDADADAIDPDEGAPRLPSGSNSNGNDNNGATRDEGRTNSCKKRSLSKNIKEEEVKLPPDEAAATSKSNNTNGNDDDDDNGNKTGGCLYSDAYLSESEEQNVPLHTAVKFGTLDFVDEELAKIDSNGNGDDNQNSENDSQDINQLDSAGRTALDLAALTGQLDLVEKLRSIEGSVFAYRPGSRMMLIARKRSKDVEEYLREIRDTVK